MSQVFENSGSTAIVTYAYDDLSRMTGITRANSAATAASYDTNSRDWDLSLSGTSNSKNLALDFTYTPGVQLNTRDMSNGDYLYSPSGSSSHSYFPNSGDTILN
jgi:YD repeat-containing protein